MFVLFNKNKEFIGYSPDFPNIPNLNIFKFEISQDKSDLTEWKWVGDMLTGKMIKIND